MSEDNGLIFSGDAKIEYFYEYFLTATGEAVEAKRKEAQEKYGIGQYYFMGFSFDGEKKGLSYDDLKAAVFGADRSTLIADVERLQAENERLRAAMKPFADFALRFIEHIAVDPELFTTLDGEHKLLNYSNSPTLSDLRKTYFAMKGGEG